MRNSGNRAKSRSRVSSASAPWATQIAAILASWTTPPRTRGPRTKRSSVSGKSLVSPMRRREGESIHPASWRHACSGVETVSFQILGFVTTLRNSKQHGQGIAQGSSPSARVRTSWAAGSWYRDSWRWAYTRMFVSTAITGAQARHRLCLADLARSTPPEDRGRPHFQRSGPEACSSNPQALQTALASIRPQQPLATIGLLTGHVASRESATRPGCRESSS